MVGLQGRVLGRYQLADQLASGGIAEVYRGRSTVPGGREIVVKIIFPEISKQPGFRSRFDQIVQASRRLSHPHILPLLDSGEQHGYLYLVTPFVAFGTLRDWLRGGRRLGAHDVAPFFRQLCEAVGFAHGQGLVHGNIKPSNIYLHEGRHVLLGDFGRLWDVGQVDLARAGQGADAVEFMAPEAIDGHADQRSDIYSLGAVLFAGLTGRLPFTGATPFEVKARHAGEPVPHLWEVSASTGGIVLLDQVVQRALAKPPAARFPTAGELAQAIDAAVRTQPAGTGASAALSGMAASPLFASGGSSGLPPALSDALGPGAVFSTTPFVGSTATPASPLSGLVDPAMEEGRSGRLAPASPRPGELAALPTTALPAQPGALGAPGGWASGAGAWAQGKPGASSAPSAPSASRSPGAGGDGVVEQATQRVPAPPGGSPPSAALPPSLLPSPETPPAEDGARAAPAEVPPPAPPGAGFVVAGGSAQWPPRTADLAGAPAGAEMAGAPSAGGGDAFAQSTADAGSPGARSFSPTSLGLPRLTMPELGDIPSSWQDEIAEPGSAGASAFEGGEPPDRWGEVSQWGASADADSGWSVVMPADRHTPSLDWHVSGPMAAAGTSETASAGHGKHQKGARPGLFQRRGKASAAVAEVEEPAGQEEGDPFADPSAWASPYEIDRRGRIRGARGPIFRRPRRVRRLLLMIVLLLVVDGAISGVTRPDLCPRRVCTTVDTQVLDLILKVDQNITDRFQPRSPLVATPSSVTLRTYAGGTATTSVAVKNTVSDPSDWTASGSVAWLTVTPTSGTLAPGATATLTLTAKPSISLRPGAYDVALQVMVGKTLLKVPTSVVIAGPARLSVTPTALSFARCDTSQQVTVSNTGGGPLTFTATPLESALVIDPASATVNPGATRKLTVSLDCSATRGSTYGVNIVSNGGSAAITISF